MNDKLNKLPEADGETDRGRHALRFLLKLAAVLLVIGLVATSLVMVDETEYVIVERLGQIVAVYDQPEQRGLHVKLPWPIDFVRRFDRRVQLLDPPGREIFTADRKNITIDAFVCWKIAEPKTGGPVPFEQRPVVRFFRSLGAVDVAEARLDTRIRSTLGTEIGQVDLSGLLNVADSEAGPDADKTGLMERIAETVRRQVEQREGEELSLKDRLGIELVDVRIKRINFPVGNQQAVFERMRSERRKIADRYRSAGISANTVIKSRADLQYNEILAKANRDAEQIRGVAEAEAIGILNAAHQQDPDFYQVMRTLDAYRKILNERTTLVLSASSRLLKLLTDGVPEAPSVPGPSEAPSPEVTPTGVGRGVSETTEQSSGD